VAADDDVIDVGLVDVPEDGVGRRVRPSLDRRDGLDVDAPLGRRLPRLGEQPLRVGPDPLVLVFGVCQLPLAEVCLNRIDRVEHGDLRVGERRRAVLDCGLRRPGPARHGM
jgi:hypothetical protein